MAGVLSGPGNANGSGQSAYFKGAGAIAFDPAGNLLVADEVIRRVTPGGAVSTMAAIDARDIAAGPDGSLYLASGSELLRMNAAGAVTTVASEPTSDSHIAVGPDAVVYYATDTGIYRVGPTGQATRFAALEPHPDGSGDISDLVVDAAGNLYVSHFRNAPRVRKITPAGVSTVIASAVNGLAAPVGMALDPAGNLWVFDRAQRILRKVAPDGAVTTPFGTTPLLPGSATNQPGQLAFNAAGELFLSHNYGVSRVLPSGGLALFVGHVPGAAAQWENVSGLAVDGAGNAYTTAFDFASTPPRLLLRRYASNGQALAFGGTGEVVALPAATLADAASRGFGTGYAGGVAVDADGNAYTSDVSLKRVSSGFSNSVEPVGGAIYKTTPAGAVSEVVAWREGTTNPMAPVAVTNGPAGALFFVDAITGSIVRWTAAAGATVLARPVTAARISDPWSLAVDAAGRVYVMIDNVLSRVEGGTLVAVAGAQGVGGSADGIGAAARFQTARARLVADAGGNVYVADGEVIRKVTPAGVVTTVAGQRGSLGVQPGPLPGTLGELGPLAIGADGVLYAMSSGAIVKIKLD